MSKTHRSPATDQDQRLPDDAAATALKWAQIAAWVVAISSALISYNALAALGREANINYWLSWLYPITLDGTVALGMAAALGMHDARKRTRAYIWVVTLSAIAVSVVGNGWHAYAGGNGWFGMAASAMPALMLASSMHLLAVFNRKLKMAEKGRSGERAEQLSEPAQSVLAERSSASVPVSVPASVRDERFAANGSTNANANGGTTNAWANAPTNGTNAPTNANAQRSSGSVPANAPTNGQVNGAKAPRKLVSAAVSVPRGVVSVPAERSLQQSARASVLLEQWERAGEPVTSVRLAEELGCSPSWVRRLPAWRSYQERA